MVFRAGEFQAGDKALLTDSKGRRYLITLQTGGSFHFHRGIIEHEAIIGLPEGRTINSTGHEPVQVFRPTYADFVLKMPRGAQVIYPKDAAMILMHADIYPGARVLEAGVGSGALTIALLRAVGEQGSVCAFDLREDFIETALANIHSFMGKAENFDVRVGSLYEPIDQMEVDRVVLDLPEPWRALPQVEVALSPGGIALFYLPTILQVSKLVEHLKLRPWTCILTLENLTRTWHVEGQSVRPDHRMVAHTGFLTSARLMQAEATADSTPGE
ncbi:MAG: tRNA (adenine-N1)-methyltransferase [Actinomycetota bacterium]